MFSAIYSIFFTENFSGKPPKSQYSRDIYTGGFMARHNRRYKDSVFVDLFGEDKNAKSNFLSLYNALHGTKLDASTELELLQLE